MRVVRKTRSVHVLSLTVLVAAGAASAAQKDIALPPCGLLVGHAVYNCQGQCPSAYGNWLIRRVPVGPADGHLENPGGWHVFQ